MPGRVRPSWPSVWRRRPWLPLFARTADLDHSGALAEGRRHKESPRRRRSLGSLGGLVHAAALSGGCECGGVLLRRPCRAVAATLPQVRAACDFYGAEVSSLVVGHPIAGLLPRGGWPALLHLRQADPLIPLDHRLAIQAGPAAGSIQAGDRLRYVAVINADHGFMCEARSSHRIPEACG